MKTAAQIQGQKGEDIAYLFLKKKGYRVRERNYRISGGEIDLIAERDGILVFVEVKTRSSNHYGYPEESVARSKKIRLARAARNYLARHPHPSFYRFDIIAIKALSNDSATEVLHIENILDDIVV